MRPAGANRIRKPYNCKVCSNRVLGRGTRVVTPYGPKGRDDGAIRGGDSGQQHRGKPCATARGEVDEPPQPVVDEYEATSAEGEISIESRNLTMKLGGAASIQFPFTNVLLPRPKTFPMRRMKSVLGFGSPVAKQELVVVLPHC